MGNFGPLLQGGPSGPPPHMFNNEQLRNIAAAQRVNPNARMQPVNLFYKLF